MVPVRVLLVDDDESVLAGLKVILEAHEFDVSTAPGVVEALRLITTERFDVLLSDLHMPGAGDGLIVAAAMRHANPRSINLILSANPDMEKATASLLREADEIFLKPPKITAIMEAIRGRLGGESIRRPRSQTVEPIATMLERERPAIIESWINRMREIGSFAGISLSSREQTRHLPEALDEILYRLRSPQPLGRMTLFSMTSLQHGARRRRQGLLSPVLVEEARALQVALFDTVHDHLDSIDLGQLPPALMAIADEVNAQLLQSLSGYENEKPGSFGPDGG